MPIFSDEFTTICKNLSDHHEHRVLEIASFHQCMSVSLESMEAATKKPLDHFKRILDQSVLAHCRDLGISVETFANASKALTKAGTTITILNETPP